MELCCLQTLTNHGPLPVLGLLRLGFNTCFYDSRITPHSTGRLSCIARRSTTILSDSQDPGTCILGKFECNIRTVYSPPMAIHFPPGVPLYIIIVLPQLVLELDSSPCNEGSETAGAKADELLLNSYGVGKHVLLVEFDRLGLRAIAVPRQRHGLLFSRHRCFQPFPSSGTHRLQDCIIHVE